MHGVQAKRAASLPPSENRGYTKAPILILAFSARLTACRAPKAITAMAHHLARLLYRMLKFGTAYVDKGTEYYEAKYPCHQMKWLQKKAAALNLQLIPTQACDS